MKKLFLGSIALALFSISLTLIQFSCGDKVNAKPTTNQLQQSKILFSVIGTSMLKEVWIANYDGTNKTQVPLTNLPGNLDYGHPAEISPDGQTIFIIAHVPVSNPDVTQIYSMSINGTNVKKIIEYTDTGNVGSIAGVQAY